MSAALMTREDAIARIAEVFREYGYEGTSLGAITDATGLGKGGLYDYFPGGKDEIAAAVLEQIAAWFAQQVFRPLREEPVVATALDHMFDNTDTYFQGGGRICLVGAFALDATRDRFAAAVKDYFAEWVIALRVALQRGGLDSAHAEALAEMVVAGIQGGLVLSRAMDDPALFRRQADHLAAMLNAALL